MRSRNGDSPQWCLDVGACVSSSSEAPAGSWSVPLFPLLSGGNSRSAVYEGRENLEQRKRSTCLGSYRRGVGIWKSSPTRNTRDLLLKVVPTIARVSFHLLLNPPRPPRPAYSKGCSFLPFCTLHLDPVTRSLSVHCPAAGALNLAPGDPAHQVFKAAKKGRGEMACED